MNTDIQLEDDRLELIEDEPPENGASTKHGQRPWRILIVDDDEQVHSSTLFALSDTTILGRKLDFLHAYSAAEARSLLSQYPDVAVIFLDVVMESEDAGLTLVRVIREEYGLREARIILRTGQPGYAPELEAIRDYDINDYRTKSELTRTRLVTSLTTALRSYEQIRTIAYSRHGLEKIVTATADLFELRALETLAEGVLTQIAGLLGFSANGVVCAQRGYPLDHSDPDHLYIVGAVGRYASAINHPLEELGNPQIERLIHQCVDSKQNLYGDGCSVLYLKSPGGTEEAIYLDAEAPLEAMDQQLVEVFASNISVGFSNVYLFSHLNHLAYYDPLTSLPNRHKLLELIDGYWMKHGDGYWLYLIDIDHFADINDVLGQKVGDTLIRAVADRLQVRFPEAQLCRYGGDVLCVVGASGQLSADAVLGVFRTAFELDECRLPISVTVGECHASYQMSGVEALTRAGLALTEGKHGVRGRVVSYQPEMTEASRQRMELMQALRLAIQANQLKLHYQPQLNLATGRVIGAEALLRWTREDGKAVSPAVFIPVAERSDLIYQIGEWVIEEACRQQAEWIRAGLEHIKMAINVSPQQVRLGACTPILKRAMDRYQLKSGQIEVEITESMVLDDIEGATACLECFRDSGVGIALDDFGTGFSSLSYLHRLPIDTLKVDRAFVGQIGSGSQAEQIAEVVVALGKILKMRVLAEGVETEAQAEALRSWGCDEAQGFLYAPALEPQAFVAWVQEWERARRR
jgi:diguanylate cyclase (GGDEF)-like protein